MQAVETFRAGFEALKDQASASADGVPGRMKPFAESWPSPEREKESLSAILNDLSASGEKFLGAIEKLKAQGHAPPRRETPGAAPEAGESR